jgi:release factor glutamine methyltransferase
VTIGEALAGARRRLKDAEIEDADLEAEVLLRHTLRLDRAALFAHLDAPLPDDARQRFEAFLARRLGHEPTAYITGQREFFGLDFEVSPAVLIPRPETETLVEAAIELARPRGRIRRGAVIADVGTGSGAIAVALAKNVPRADVYAIDSSVEALDLARRNAERHGVSERIMFLRGDLLSPLPEYVDIVVANLPYVPSEVIPGLVREIREHEPLQALDGGPNGLEAIERLLAEAPDYLRPNGCLCLEFGDGQAAAVCEIARRSFPDSHLTVRKDMAGRERVLVISP